MSKGKSTLTDKVLVGAVAGLVLYEGYTLLNKAKADTISERVRKAAKSKMYLTFFAGLLCGHWFWPLDEMDPLSKDDNGKRSGLV